jgi:hypothetical protein
LGAVGHDVTIVSFRATKQSLGEAIYRHDRPRTSRTSYDFGNLMPFVQKLRGGDDLVMGNRFMGGRGAGCLLNCGM